MTISIGRETGSPSANGTEERARNERSQAVDAAITAIEKQFPKNLYGRANARW